MTMASIFCHIPAGIERGGFAGIELGRCELPRRSGDAHLYRINHPLARWSIEQAKARALDVARLVSDYNAHGSRVSTLEAYRGKIGWLTVKLISVETLGNQEQHLLVAAGTTDGLLLAEEDPEKLLRLPATMHAASLFNTPDASLLADLEARKTALLRDVNQRNLGYFEQEVQKLDAWADDLKLGLEQQIKEIDREINQGSAPHCRDLADAGRETVMAEEAARTGGQAQQAAPRTVRPAGRNRSPAQRPHQSVAGAASAAGRSATLFTVEWS